MNSSYNLSSTLNDFSLFNDNLGESGDSFVFRLVNMDWTMNPSNPCDLNITNGVPFNFHLKRDSRRMVLGYLIDLKLTFVPNLRLFGHTPSGQSVCCLVHNYFPYFFVRYDGDLDEHSIKSYCNQFASDLNTALNETMPNQSKATNAKYWIVAMTLVQATEFYGYSTESEPFIKVYYRMPNHQNKILNLLKMSKVMGKFIQPYELHCPYHLQFLMDYCLSGMGWIKLKKFKFKLPMLTPIELSQSSTPLVDSNDSLLQLHSIDSRFNMDGFFKVWTDQNTSKDFTWGDAPEGSIVKKGLCHLEVDVVPWDIVRAKEVECDSSQRVNIPTLKALWKDPIHLPYQARDPPISRNEVIEPFQSYQRLKEVLNFKLASNGLSEDEGDIESTEDFNWIPNYIDSLDEIQLLIKGEASHDEIVALTQSQAHIHALETNNQSFMNVEQSILWLETTQSMPFTQAQQSNPESPNADHDLETTNIDNEFNMTMDDLSELMKETLAQDIENDNDIEMNGLETLFEEDLDLELIEDFSFNFDNAKLVNGSPSNDCNEEGALNLDKFDIEKSPCNTSNHDNCEPSADCSLEKELDFDECEVEVPPPKPIKDIGRFSLFDYHGNSDSIQLDDLFKQMDTNSTNEPTTSTPLNNNKQTNSNQNNNDINQFDGSNEDYFNEIWQASKFKIQSTRPSNYSTNHSKQSSKLEKNNFNRVNTTNTLYKRTSFIKKYKNSNQFYQPINDDLVDEVVPARIKTNGINIFQSNLDKPPEDFNKVAVSSKRKLQTDSYQAIDFDNQFRNPIKKKLIHLNKFRVKIPFNSIINEFKLNEFFNNINNQSEINCDSNHSESDLISQNSLVIDDESIDSVQDRILPMDNQFWVKVPKKKLNHIQLIQDSDLDDSSDTLVLPNQLESEPGDISDQANSSSLLSTQSQSTSRNPVNSYINQDDNDFQSIDSFPSIESEKHIKITNSSFRIKVPPLTIKFTKSNDQYPPNKNKSDQSNNQDYETRFIERMSPPHDYYMNWNRHKRNVNYPLQSSSQNQNILKTKQLTMWQYVLHPPNVNDLRKKSFNILEPRIFGKNPIKSFVNPNSNSNSNQTKHRSIDHLNPASKIKCWMPIKPPPSFQQALEWLKLNQPMDDIQKVSKPKVMFSPSQLIGRLPSRPVLKSIQKKMGSLHRSSRTNWTKLMLLEIHANTSSKLQPDPKTDPIAFVVYRIDYMHPEERDENSINRGIILVESSTSDKNSIFSKENSKNFNLISVKDEFSLFSRLIQLMHREDPDIVMGYEIHMGSLGYLVQRAQVLADFNILDTFARYPPANLDAEKAQNPYHHHHTTSLTITGRHVLNVWRVMRSEMSVGCTSFTLENMAQRILNLQVPKFDNYQLTKWLTAEENPTNNLQTLTYYFNQLDLIYKLLLKLNIFFKIEEFSKIYGIDFMDVIMRGSQFKVESLMFRLTKPRNFILVTPTPGQVNEMRAPECLPLVMEPTSGLYQSPVVVLDFQSLYPSIMIGYNYCYSTCVGKIDQIGDAGQFGFLEDRGWDATYLARIKDHIQISPNGMGFVKSNIRKGILSDLLEDLLSTRVMVKKTMKGLKSGSPNDAQSLLNMLDSRQLGLKLLANVIFGYTAANYSGRMPNVEIADSIVQTGHEILEKTIRLINNNEKWNARVIYGDTDSVFVHLPTCSKSEAFAVGKEIAVEVTKQFADPILLKFEKVYYPCTMLTKKRYVGMMYETEDQLEPVFDAKGIETVRRDNCPAVQKILYNSLTKLFDGYDRINEVKLYVTSELERIVRGKVSLQDFIIAKEVKLGSYKPRGLPLGARLAMQQMEKDPRLEPQYGQRVPYVIISGPPSARLKDLIVSPQQFLANSNYRINSEYYIRRQILPALDRVFGMLGISVQSWFEEVRKVNLPVGSRTYLSTRSNIQYRDDDLENFDYLQFLDNDKRQEEKFQQVTITNYFQSKSCINCQEIVSKSDQDSTDAKICSNCLKNKSMTYLRLRQRCAQLETKVARVTEVCTRCCEGQSLAPLARCVAIESSNAEGQRSPGSLCVNSDCPIYFTRNVIQHRDSTQMIQLTRTIQSLDW